MDKVVSCCLAFSGTLYLLMTDLYVEGLRLKALKSTSTSEGP